MPMEIRRGHQIPVVSHHVSSRNRSGVLCKNSKCSYMLSSSKVFLMQITQESLEVSHFTHHCSTLPACCLRCEHLALSSSLQLSATYCHTAPSVIDPNPMEPNAQTNPIFYKLPWTLCFITAREN